MLVEEFLGPRILIVSGKGGVGKTTVSAALAVLAARQGRKVCIAEVDAKGTLPRLFGDDEIGYEPTELAPDIWALNIRPDEALAEYLKVQYRMGRMGWVFTSTHFVDYITAAGPGLKDVLVLGKVWYLEQRRGTRHDFDTIIVDAPAAGHMVSFLSAPIGLGDALRVGPIRRQADWLAEMLRDPLRSRLHLVTLAEQMPVSETIETSRRIEERIGINQGATFANAIYSRLLADDEEQRLDEMKKNDDLSMLKKEAEAVGMHLDDDEISELVGYADFLQGRRSIQQRYIDKLEEHLRQPLIELPFLFSAGLALPDIENLADVMEERIGRL